MIRNTLLVLSSCAACLLAGEAVTRTVFNPIDFLKVSLVEDPVLSYKIPPKESGHDANGFRNKSIPDHVDVLAIGDSMTYGVMATTDQSWPAQLGNITGGAVYNAGIGGYGLPHYLHNIKTLTPDLSPQTIVMAVYVGNDFLDTYNLVYNKEHWKEYRDPGNTDTVEDEPLLSPVSGRFLGGTRDWLSHTSVLYRVATQNASFDKARIQERYKSAEQSYLIDHGAAPVLLSQNTLAYADITDARIQEGLDIAKRMILETQSYCSARGIDFHIAIMPVKEQVYMDALPGLFTAKQREDLKPFMENFEALHQTLGAFLDAQNISFVDLKPALTAALKTDHIYPGFDGHPNGKGYEVAAKTIAHTLSKPAT